MTHPAGLDPVLREQILARLRARPALWRQYVVDTGGDESFGLWLFTLDATIARTAGLTHADLPDQPWRDEHDAGTDPVRYARHVITTELTYQHP